MKVKLAFFINNEIVRFIATIRTIKTIRAKFFVSVVIEV